MTSRRAFVGGRDLVSGAALLGSRPVSVAAEPPPETKRIRLVKIPSICRAPHYVADEFLRGELNRWGPKAGRSFL